MENRKKASEKFYRRAASTSDIIAEDYPEIEFEENENHFWLDDGRTELHFGNVDSSVIAWYSDSENHDKLGAEIEFARNEVGWSEWENELLKFINRTRLRRGQKPLKK